MDSIISNDISRAAALLEAEELVAIPTETVYGLAGNIYSEKAIKLIFETKERPLFNPLIVHVSSPEKLAEIVSYVPEKARLLTEAFWPGPLTLVLKKNPSIPNLITAGKETVAVRVPNHPVALELLEKLNFPLAAPSANPFGSISPTKAEHVDGYFKDKIKMVLDGGPCQRGIESTIIGFEGEDPLIYRLGSTSIEDIEAIVGPVKVKNKKEIAPDAPGMLDRHYAPSTKTILVEDLSKAIEANKDKKIGVLSLKPFVGSNEILHQIVLSESENMQEAASKLYDALHQLDTKNLDLIIAERFPDSGLGRSINDRLERATVR